MIEHTQQCKGIAVLYCNQWEGGEKEDYQRDVGETYKAWTGNNVQSRDRRKRNYGFILQRKAN